MKKGILLVISGPAGSGKGSVNKILTESGEYVLSVSRTTRAPRFNERDGVHYHFVTRERFLELLDEGDFIEHAEYCDNFYGTPKSLVEKSLEEGKNVILEIEVDGALQVKRSYPDAVLIMLLAPDAKTQEARLRGRGTESDEIIKKRLERTRFELSHLNEYDYIVYNRDNETALAAEEIRAIVRSEKLSARRDPEASIKYFGE